MKRTIQTVADVPAPQERWKALNEIDAVKCVICVFAKKVFLSVFFLFVVGILGDMRRNDI